jgi:hypothetical protein
VPNLLVRIQKGSSTDVESQAVAEPSLDIMGFSAWPWVFRNNFVKLNPRISIGDLRSFTRWAMDPELRPIKNFISTHIWIMPEVLRVVASFDENRIITIRTIIDSEDRTARYRVYEFEQRIVEAFPRVVFNFSVINLRNFLGADLETFTEDCGDILYDKIRADSNDEVPIYASGLGENLLYPYVTNLIYNTFSNVSFSSPCYHQSFNNWSNENIVMAKTSTVANDVVTNASFEPYFRYVNSNWEDDSRVQKG